MINSSLKCGRGKFENKNPWLIDRNPWLIPIRETFVRNALILNFFGLNWVKMRLCEVLRNTISSEYKIIKQKKIEDQILINFILCIANE